MKNKFIFIFIISLLLIFSVFSKPNNKEINQINKLCIFKNPEFFYPIEEFKTRITKKYFGLYITPKNSPVQPERFTGYHTGVDVEYENVETDIPVYAISDAVVVLSRTSLGYGGVFAITVNINGFPHTVLYGHIRPSSLPKIGQKVTKGQKIALLGTGYSKETDGERRHLHFAILSDNRIDLKGYVQSKKELTGWIDPLSFY